MEAQPQMGPEGMIGLLVGGVVQLLGLAIGIAIAVAICYFLWTIFKRIPQEHRKMDPNMVWLLIIPLFNLIWNFFVFLKMPDSFKSYFDSQGITDVGDCGRNLGLAFSIAAACSIIPLLNCLAFPVALVLLILVLIKFNDLKNRLPQEADPYAGE